MASYRRKYEEAFTHTHKSLPMAKSRERSTGKNIFLHVKLMGMPFLQPATQHLFALALEMRVLCLRYMSRNQLCK